MTKRIFFIILIILAIVCVWTKRQTKGFSNGENKYFVIEKGQSVKEISANLKNDGFIRNSFVFKTYVWKKKIENKFQTGRYSLNTGMNIGEIAEILTAGKVLSKEREIRIIEGWNINDIAEYLDKENLIKKDKFISFSNEKNIKIKNYDFLDAIPKENNLEGFLFPDTYRVYKNSTVKDLAVKMFDNFDKKLTDEMKEDIKKQDKEFYNIMIMASIIQKEVRNNDDMEKVSDIFWRRFENKMPLQSCATIAYILGVNKDQYSYEDTRIESPYNTYINRGLPPSPICNPGIDAIKAAIYPEKNKYWYFLSKSENGETVFSKSLDEHNINKAKYLK